MMKSKEIPAKNIIFKHLIILAVPIIFSNIMQNIYQLIDTFWVGRLGVSAVAAISVSYPILFLMLTLGGGFAIAGTILVAQFKGKKDTEQVNYISSQTIIFVFILAIVISITGYFLTPLFIRAMGADKSIFQSAVSYLKLSFIGGIFLFLFMTFQSLSQGVGIVKLPAKIVFMTVLLNLVLDPVFIFGFYKVPAMGVNGAAVATIISQFIASALGIYYLFKGSCGIKISFKSYKPDFFLLKKIFKLGVPVSVEYFSRGLVMALITAIVATFGTKQLASYGIGIRVFTFIVIIGVGLSTATSTLVGQKIGAGREKIAEEVAKVSFLTAFTAFLSLGIIFFICSKEIAGFFIPHDSEAIKLTVTFIKILSIGFGFLGIQISLNGTFRGSGNTVISMFLTVLTMWILRLPLCFILSKFVFHNVTGIWIAFPVSNFITSVIGVILFCQGGWKRKKIA